MNNQMKDTYTNGECPDCFDKIPDEVEEGDACSNCGHVFCDIHENDLDEEEIK